jgi:ABC-type branched-subunit amino acid transport system substrate-binding protein
VFRISAMQERYGKREGGVFMAGRSILPVVGLSLFLVIGCRFGESTVPAPAPAGGASGGPAGRAGGPGAAADEESRLAEPENRNVAASIGVVLSTSGSPALRQISEEVLEGIEVALAVEERVSGVPIRLITVDDAGTFGGLNAAMSALGQQRIAGIVGPISDPMVAAAAGLRASTVPLLSPSARFVPEDVTGVLSLSGSDPAAGRGLAELVLSRGVRQVVLLRPASPEMQEEARWFRDAYLGQGGTILREVAYPPETTGFREILEDIAGLSPRGLVILLPPGGADLQQLAPQVSFYGLNEIPNLVRFGNESWTSSAALQGIDPRHMNGVYSVSRTVRTGEFGPGWNEFRSAYEEHFRRTLRSLAPAFGFDTARLLLQAARRGGGDPQRTLQALEEVRDYPGATGTLSVVNGRIERHYYPVRIENRVLIPLSP